MTAKAPGKPWLVWGLLCLVWAMATMLVLLNALGENGLPKGPDGKLATPWWAFLLLILMGVGFCASGIHGLVTGEVTSVADDTKKFHGTSARVIGGLQCVAGASAVGGCVYALVFCQ
jgi:hypothetical protein